MMSHWSGWENYKHKNECHSWWLIAGVRLCRENIHVGKALRQAKGTTTNLKSSLVPHSVTSQTNQLHKNNRENAGRWKLLPTLNTVYFSFFSWEGIRTKVPLFLLHLTDVQENNTFFYKCCQVFFLWFQIHQKCVWSLSSGKTCNACMKTS